MTHIVKSFLLLFFFSLCAAAIIVTPQFARQSAPVPRELYSIVNNQLNAFRTADFSRAYRNASTRVQQKFSLPQFESMIRRNYAEMMKETQRVEFGVARAQGESAILQVFFGSGFAGSAATLPLLGLGGCGLAATNVLAYYLLASRQTLLVLVMAGAVALEGVLGLMSSGLVGIALAFCSASLSAAVALALLASRPSRLVADPVAV